MNTLQKIILVLLSACCIAGCEQQPSPKITIGIIEPLEHTAMNEIVKGFSDTLASIYHQPVSIKVENAQGDANLERAIIQKMRDANYAMIVPIGVGVTQMTLAMAHNQPVVSLASSLSDEERKHMQPCHATAVHDEISADQILNFIHTAYPQIKRLTLVHSAADKVLPEVDDTIKMGKKYGITIDHRMVATLPELYTAAQTIPADTQGIFVLKDSMIVSGIATLAKTATSRQIPLITSDQGSVQDGAGLAVGVHERDIGVEGAKLAGAVLNGNSICELPIAEMKKLTVFINKPALAESKQAVDPLINAAKALHYNTEEIK